VDCRRRLALCSCGQLATHDGCPLCPPTCDTHRPPCLICGDWSRIGRRPLLRVQERLRGRLWALQLPPDGHARVFLALSRGWRDDEPPLVATDVTLEFAEWLPWAGEA
jgi:hypothetical protein